MTVLKFALGVCASFSLFIPAAFAQSDAPDTSAMLVLDSSGSMWGKIGEDTKLSIARDVIDNMVDDWDDKTPLGLMTYGHRRKGDCTDIELLLPAEKMDKTVFKKTVRGLNPTGKTPMVQSVLNAAGSLSFESQKATVILVSDGEETCGLDPCTIGASLKEKGVDFTAHVIGFDVSYAESAGLKCLAEETGGRYFAAENADELFEAFEQVAQDTQAPVDDKVGDATIEVAEKEVVAGSKFNVKWTGPQNQGDGVTVFDVDGKKRYDSRYVFDPETPDTVGLAAPETPGTYHVHYYTRHKKSLAYDVVTVIAATAKVDAPDTPVVGGAKTAFKIEGPNNAGDNLVFTTAAGERVGISARYTNVHLKGGGMNLVVPETPGEYIAQYRTRGGKVLAKDSFTVIAAEAYLETPKQDIIGGHKFDVKISKPNENSDEVKIYDKNRKRVKDEFIHIYYKDGVIELTAPETPGTYSVEYETRGKKTLAKDTITVIAATASLSVANDTLKTGEKFKVTTSEPMVSSDRVKIYNSDNRRVSEKYIKSQFKDGGIIISAPKNPGTYTVVYETRGKKRLASDTITVIAADP
ncbi:MAG: VWA domain-containing protein [Acidimicrobiales bacterium]|nr:VWA domain-containing protein [Hyphomonadaceae bacterium]RZV41427.1 MAG: VWA domain-containing protein [Acidimicrobiales bacterium]